MSLPLSLTHSPGDLLIGYLIASGHPFKPIINHFPVLLGIVSVYFQSICFQVILSLTINFKNIIPQLRTRHTNTKNQTEIFLIRIVDGDDDGFFARNQSHNVLYADDNQMFRY